MNVNQKGFANIILIVIVVILVGVAGYFTFVKNSEPIAQQSPSAVTNTPPARATSPTPTPTTTSSSSIPQSSTETPIVEKNVSNQPAYLMTAYSKNGKDYIDVDYVEWLGGEASIKAKVEDGECISVSVCEAYPNGYKRNRNPKIRTFEVSPSAHIEVNGMIAFIRNRKNKTNSMDPLISFKELEKAILEPFYYPDTPEASHFTKTFVVINVKNNIVTKIVEPFQE